MTELFEKKIVVSLVTELSKWKSDDELAKLYQWPIEGALDRLPEQYKSIAAEVNKGSGTLEKSLLLRQKLKELPFDLDLSKWIVEVWGGITGKDDESLKSCIEKADKQDFDFNRIASWSKHVAFKNPEQYAIYDARVIYSLNWLLLKAGSKRYFPAPSGRNSVMELLDYRILLLIKHYEVSGVEKHLNEDIDARKKSPGRKSYVANKLNKELFIESKNAFTEYCNLLLKIKRELYQDDPLGMGLTKVEMMLFSLADKDIALEVLRDFSKVVNFISDDKSCIDQLS